MKIGIIIVIILGLLTAGALNYHIILVDGGIKLLKKADMTLEYTFVDARGAKKFKLFLIPELARAGLKELLREEGITVER
jgi:hypothetical protein